MVGVEKGFPKPAELQPPPGDPDSQQSWPIESYDQFMGLFPHVGRPVSVSFTPASKVRSVRGQDEGFEKSAGEVSSQIEI